MYSALSSHPGYVSHDLWGGGCFGMTLLVASFTPCFSSRLLLFATCIWKRVHFLVSVWAYLYSSPRLRTHIFSLNSPFVSEWSCLLFIFSHFGSFISLSMSLPSPWEVDTLCPTFFFVLPPSSFSTRTFIYFLFFYNLILVLRSSQEQDGKSLEEALWQQGDAHSHAGLGLGRKDK